MSRSQELFTLHARIEHETANAILIDHDSALEPIWIPLSQVEKIVRVEPAPWAQITMTMWIAKQKDLI